MKDIKNFNAPKYNGAAYTLVEDGIYKTEEGGDTVYVTSLSFIQEPELGEGGSAAEISQYPLEDILDKFLCYISDFYPELNTADSQVCCLEFAGSDVEALRKLRSIIGKHAYDKKDGPYVKLCIE